MVYYGAVRKRKEINLTLHTYDIVMILYRLKIDLMKNI